MDDIKTINNETAKWCNELKCKFTKKYVFQVQTEYLIWKPGTILLLPGHRDRVIQTGTVPVKTGQLECLDSSEKNYKNNREQWRFEWMDRLKVPLWWNFDSNLFLHNGQEYTFRNYHAKF